MADLFDFEGARKMSSDEIDDLVQGMDDVMLQQMRKAADTVSSGFCGKPRIVMTVVATDDGHITMFSHGSDASDKYVILGVLQLASNYIMTRTMEAL